MADEAPGGSGNGSGNGNGSGSGNGSGGDGLIRAQKTALAFRYRPSTWSSLDEGPDPRQAGDGDGDGDGGEASSSAGGTSSNSNFNSNSKRKYELTLEYGPARTGRTLDRESVPLVVNSDSHALYPGDGKAYSAEHDHGDVVIGDDERLVMWDNQARVYYRNRIDGEDWAGAYYIAPISGAVLTKVLEHAVEYAEQHRRYQPFEVVALGDDADDDDDDDDDHDDLDDHDDDGGGGGRGGRGDGRGGDDRGAEAGAGGGAGGTARRRPRTVLRSSSSDDFVWAIFDVLASMYVDIRPVLAPPRQSLRFFVDRPSDVTKLSGMVSPEDLALPGVPVGGGAGAGGDGDGDGRQRDEEENGGGGGGGRSVASLAADFYSKFYDCANAIRTGDYGLWESGSDDDGGEDNGDGSRGRRAAGLSPHSRVEAARKKKEEEKEEHDDDGDEDLVDVLPAPFDVNQASQTIAEESVAELYTGVLPVVVPPPEGGGGDDDNDDDDGGTSMLEDGSAPATAPDDIDEVDEDDEEEGEEGDEEETDDEGGSDQNAEQEQVDEATAAVDAAQEALDAAKSAAESASSLTDKAAAEEATAAAAKAAEASSRAKAAAAKDMVFSVDGAQMTSILGSCFRDARYGIRQDSRIEIPEIDGQVVDEKGKGQSSQRYATVTTTNAYLYVDGSNYYRLNLTAPYWEATSNVQPMPQPKAQGFEVDVIDHIFFWAIIGGFAFGITVMLHVLGVLRVDPRLKFKNFFHPPHPDRPGRDGYLSAADLRVGDVSDLELVDDDSFDGGEVPRRRGGGQEHPFQSADAIPSQFIRSGHAPVRKGYQDDDEAAIELSEVNRSRRPHTPLEAVPLNNMGRSPSNNRLRRSPVEAAVPLPAEVRMARDPMSVDWPGIESRTPVAVPVGANPRTTNGHMQNGKVKASLDVTMALSSDIDAEYGEVIGATGIR